MGLLQGFERGIEYEVPHLLCVAPWARDSKIKKNFNLNKSLLSRVLECPAHLESAF